MGAHICRTGKQSEDNPGRKHVLSTTDQRPTKLSSCRAIASELSTKNLFLKKGWEMAILKGQQTRAGGEPRAAWGMGNLHRTEAFPLRKCGVPLLFLRGARGGFLKMLPISGLQKWQKNTKVKTRSHDRWSDGRCGNRVPACRVDPGRANEQGVSVRFRNTEESALEDAPGFAGPWPKKVENGKRRNSPK